MQMFFNKDSKTITMQMIKVIQDNKAFLSEIDGAIGDGDHGINMSKGFTLCEAVIKDKDIDFANSLLVLGDILFNEIGGSMGPIYGLLFTEMGNSIKDKDIITAEDTYYMLTSGLTALQDIVTAKVGDKTLMDVLIPAINSMKATLDSGCDLKVSLLKMKEAAINGRNITKDMIARLGRASRLGERSRGVIDAGAASCCLLLSAIADGIIVKMVDQ